MNVVCGRTAYGNESNVADGGVAGGYVGLMRGGTVTNGQSFDAKAVRAMRAAGGFAGRMESGGAVELGGVEVLGLNLNAGQLLNLAQVLVPVVKSSSVQGFRTGMSVESTGIDLAHEVGFAGGYVGFGSGAQVWGDATFSDAGSTDDRWTTGATHAGYVASGCSVSNLRRVSGANCVGGYAGLLTAGGIADVNANASSGLLQKILDAVVSTPNDLAQVIQATVSTVRGAHASSVAPDPSLAQTSPSASEANAAAAAWGFTVDGVYESAGTTSYARAAGGFAGSMRAVVAGEKDRADGVADDTANSLSVTGLRGVEGGQFAGGFVGLADVTSVASLGGSPEGDQGTSLLMKLLTLGNVSALDAFRTYIYHASASGVADGFQVRAHDAGSQGILDSKRFTGAAGGFGGALINATAEHSEVSGLSSVSAPNYSGGFVGHLGKSGTVDADNAQLKGLLGATAGVLDIWGSHVEDSTVAGVAAGYTVTSAHEGDYGAGTDSASGREVAGGFVGLADLARVKGCSAANLKLVTSGEVSGGFVGETVRAYLVDAQVSSVLLDVVLKVVDALVKLLYLDKAQDLGVIDIGALFPGLGKVIDLKVLAEGETLYVNLFGLKIGVALSKDDEIDGQQTDVAIVTIGDSVVKLPCTKDGINVDESQKANLSVQLIKGNRTRVENSSAAGILLGYDVFGGGASQTGDGVVGLASGYAGGFAGHNDEGVLANCSMIYADVVRGTSRLVDPFANTTLKSAWDFNSLSDIMGPDGDGAYNTYRIYRSSAPDLASAVTANSSLGTGSSYAFASREGDAATGFDRFTVSLFKPVDAQGVSVNTYDGTVPPSGAAGDASTAWLGIKGALRQSADGSASQSLDAYVSDAKAQLMMDSPVTSNGGALTPEPGEGQDPCDTFATLTLQKVWDDRGDADGIRPKSIKLLVTATYVDAQGVTQTPASIVREGADGPVANPIEVVLTSDDADAWTSTWRTTVAGLPVAFDDGSGTPRYFTYSVTAEQVGADGASASGVLMQKVGAADVEYVAPSEAGYSSAVTSRANDLTITVTNTHRSALPNTGGHGLWWIALLGCALLVAGAWMAHRRLKRFG